MQIFIYFRHCISAKDGEIQIIKYWQLIGSKEIQNTENKFPTNIMQISYLLESYGK